jgi:hypothetical protein
LIASGKIIPLSQKPLIETSLMGQRCAASADGIYSSVLSTAKIAEIHLK